MEEPAKIEETTTAEEILRRYASETDDRIQDDAEMPLTTLTEDEEE